MIDERGSLGRRLAAGDEAAYADLYQRHGPAMYQTAARILGNEAAAQDAVQEVFLALVRGRSRLAHVEDLAAYVFSCLRHAAARISMRQGKPPLRLVEPQTASPADRAAQAEDAARVRRAVEALPDEQREVIALKVDAGLTFDQIAAVLQVSPNTAASRYRYALVKLRAQLEDRT